MAAERRRPAALRALYGALPTGIFLTFGYSVVFHGAGLLDEPTRREYVTLAVVVFALWLVFWAVIVIQRRRLGPPDPGPIEEPPRPVAEMTGRELAEWARDDPEKLRRLERRLLRRRWR